MKHDDQYLVAGTGMPARRTPYQWPVKNMAENIAVHWGMAAMEGASPAEQEAQLRWCLGKIPGNQGVKDAVAEFRRRGLIQMADVLQAIIDGVPPSAEVAKHLAMIQDMMEAHPPYQLDEEERRAGIPLPRRSLYAGEYPGG